MNIEIKPGVVLTKDEQELLSILIFHGVENYLSEAKDVCEDMQSFMLVLKELGELLAKFDFDFEVSVKKNM